MNWYKKAQESQEDLPFFKDIPKRKSTPIEQTEQYQQLLEKTPSVLQDLLDNCSNLKEAIKILKLYKFKFKIMKDVIIVYIDNKTYIIDDALTMKDAVEWVWSLYDRYLDDYIDYKDFNQEFWKNPDYVYHATTPESWQVIKKEGLLKKDRSRGINNRSTGSAIFTSYDIEEINSYGNIVIEINTPLMKSEGYMPTVSKEIPIVEYEKREALAHLIGLEDFSSDIEHGISPSTVIFYDNIPVKYLRLV